MCWFRKRTLARPTVKSNIGRFEFDNGWMTSLDGPLIITSLHDELDVAAIQKAELLLPELNKYADLAIAFVRTAGRNVWDGNGDLELEQLDISDILHDRFGLTFGIEANQDFTVSVEFRDGKPYEVWGAD